MSTASDSELRDNVKEWKAALKARVDENEAIAGSFKIDGNTVEVEADAAETFRKNLDEMKTLRSLIDGGETTLGEKNFLAQPAQDPVALMAAVAAANGNDHRKAAKTIGQLFCESEEFKALDGGVNGLTMRTPFGLKIADLAGHYIGTKDVYSALPSGDPGSFGTIQRDPLVPLPHRRRRVRDLFPVQRTNSPVIQFFKQTGFTNAASPVPERDGSAFALKPQSTIAFEGVQTTVKTIAHWEAASRTVLADEPQLRGIIDSELLYGLQLVEDAQILSGTGTGEDLPGILNEDDIQTYSWSEGEVGDNKADAIRRAITLVNLAYFEATGVVAHDNDWEDMELTKDENGQYLLAVSIALGGEQRLWRLPLVTTPAIPEGTALVGAFGLGAQLYDREDANIRVAEQHADFFIRNGVVILAEERLALATKRPEAFVDVTFDNTPAP